MLRKHTFLWVLVGAIVCATGGSAWAEMIAYYPFNEGVGTDTVDATGNGNDGVLAAGVDWVDGYKGNGVHFDTANERIVVGPIDPSAGTNAMTLAAWINWEGQGHSIGQQGIIGKREGWDPGTGIKWFWQAQPSGALLFRADWANGGGAGLWWGNTDLVPYANEWTHVALTWDDGAAISYINGEEVQTGNISFQDTADATPVSIGSVSATNGETFVGIIDEVRIYNEVLDAAGIAKAMSGDTTPASLVGPSSGQTDVRRDPTLEWSPGELAASHDVYLGTSMTDVETASRATPLGTLVSQGQQDLSYTVDGVLDIDTPYYWRIDEVNAAPDNTIFKGEVWSFTTEPQNYPITNISASASGANPTMVAENTVNGSGLNGAGEHSTLSQEMWLAPSLPAWIQFEFDAEYVVDDMKIWNNNQAIEAFIGFGAKEVDVEISIDGDTWTALDPVTVGQATGQSTNQVNAVVDMGAVTAKFVKLTINSAYGMMGQVGLSEVQFSYIPVYARTPQPADGAVDVALDAQLGWRMGRLAAAHDVFLTEAGADLALIGTADRASFDPGALEFGADYTWQINEVSDAENPVVYEGPVWTFSTQEFSLVEGFEDYSGEEGQEVFMTWFDGFGGDPILGGSTAGHIDAPFVDTSTANSGRQSLPVYYDNNGGFTDIDGQTSAPRFSEVEREFTGLDLMANGADTLSIAFRGNAGAFAEDADGNITMSAAGADVWNNSDEFRYAYKTLSGDGSVTVKVNSLVETNVWAKAGVMIRASSAPGSEHGAMVMSAANGVQFVHRLMQGGTSIGATQAAPVAAAPYWVRVTRTGNTLTAATSADGVTWGNYTATAADSVADIPLPANVLIGLAVTSHQSGVTTIAEFSDVSFTGNVTGAWTAEAIGVDMPTNSAEPVYVVLTDNAGKTGMVTHPDSAASQLSTWQDWQIPLADFGLLRFNQIEKITIGVGQKDGSQAGGEGVLFVDDLRKGSPK
jgi:regulation of enolase protein 1 (concanavalin A-like superfamily)